MVESDDEFAELCSKLLKRVRKNNNPIESQNVPKASTTARGKVKRTKPPASKKQKKDGGSREAEVGVISGPDGDRPEQRNRTAWSHLTNGLQDDGGQGEDPRPLDHVNVRDLVLERMQQFKRTVPSRLKLDSAEMSEAPSEIAASLSFGPPMAGPSVQNGGALVMPPSVGLSVQSDGALALAMPPTAGPSVQNGGALAMPPTAGPSMQSNGALAMPPTAGLSMQSDGALALAMSPTAGPSPQSGGAQAMPPTAGPSPQSGGAQAMPPTAGPSVQNGGPLKMPPTAGPSVHSDGALVMLMDVKEKPPSLEDQGLFFCQLCQKDLTAMTGALREQHVNRCLDQVESLGGNAITPSVPSCPLCGKPFSTEKSRASHLKRCAAKLDVPAQTLLQAVQRQAAEAGSEVPPQVVSGKRRGVTKQKEPSKKRKMGQTGAEMEDLMVAMALSRSIQEDKRAQTAASGQVPLELPAREKKSRRKQKDKPTPLLLFQAPEETKEKLQKRLSMLLTEEAAENRVLTLPPSHFWSIMEEEKENWRLRGGKRCVLWGISNMMEKRDPQSYYTAELMPPITPWKSPVKKLQRSQKSVNTTVLHPEKLQSQTTGDQDPESCEDKNPLSDSQKALLDLADLAGEGMTLTQWNGGVGTDHECTGRESPGSITSSGFIAAQEEKSRNEVRAPDNKLPLLVLSSDFMEMVNNPHLSDAQLQTDCGEVLHAHMFVLYARCPLLVEAIHSEGFWVDESGMGRARRILLNDVSAAATLCFLQFIYSATTDIPSGCLPHVCELARRFDVKSLIEACESVIAGTHNSEGQISTEEEEGDDGGERAETFQELLKSMWLDEGEDIFEDLKPEDKEKPDGSGGVGEGELEEIYEFALTQRKMLAEQESNSEEEDQSEDVSPKSKSLTLDEGEGMDLVIAAPPKVSPNTKVMDSSPRKSPACFLSHSPEYSVVPPIASSAKSTIEQSSSCSDVHVNVSGTSPTKQVISSVISLISPNREDDPEADMFAPHSPPPLDDSYDRMFSQTCGEYGEPSGMGESKSQINPASPPDQQPVLTSSPTAMPYPTLGSSPNIRSRSFPDRPSYSSEHEKSLHSSVRDSLHRTASQNGKEPSPKSQDADIILILSSDEEAESSNQSAAPTRSSCFAAPDIAKAIKDSPVSFTQGRRSEGLSRLEMSSSSEMSWLVPATPLPQLASSRISPLQTSCIPPTTQSLQKTSHATQSPPNSWNMSHTAQSPPKSKVTSHATPSPPNSWKTFHTAQSPPKSKVTSHATPSPPNSWKMSHTAQSPPKSKVASYANQSSPNSRKKSHTAQSPPNSWKTSDSTNSPPDSRKTSHTTWSHSYSQKSPPTSRERSSSQTSRNFDLDVSCKSLVSQTQTSPVSLPSMSPKTSRSLRPSIQESLEAQSSERSKAPSSPSISIASSTVFEVGDSEDEAPVAEPPANISNYSFQFDYDEPPIPMEEDLWGSVNETPKKPHSPPSPPLHLNKTPTKTLNCNVNSPSTAKSGTPANIEGSPPYAASQSSRQSYLNSRLWEDWEDEDPKLTAVLPLSQRLGSAPGMQKELRTPVSIVRRRELAPKVPITPLPDYSDLDTPVLKKELSKFGVRALPKKKMVLKLKEIFRYTHQVMSSESEEDVPSSQPHRSKGCGVAQVLKKPPEGKQRKQNSTMGSSSSHLGRKGTSVCAVNETDPGDDQPLTASQETTMSSLAASDTSSLSQSSNTNEFETAFADEDDNDDEALPASQAANKEALTAEAVRSFIETHPELHKRILLYQPLDLAALQAELKLNNIKIASGKLLDFLDSHCITFTTASTRKEKKSRTRRKAGKRH
ncbi:structure-specific endonuclease subunit SLX4 isoform X2 [Phyllobates terribilis]|uniref:structure-specific endonuclease subunit SLX4 isoform X2 n=1 Tax=Phyllobates terribilis TaxID=111132 RepID=UPI003CCAF44F